MSKILFSIFVLILSSCSFPRFAKDGVFVDDVDEYFNPNQKINVWVYSDFYPYNGLNSGVRLANLYPKDKFVLNYIDLKSRGTKILFSAKPKSEPSYQLLAIQHTKVSNDSFNNYERIDVDSAYYLKRDYNIKSLEIRHYYIPYGKNLALSLVYYIDKYQQLKCPFCKADYLARINANELQHKKDYSTIWTILECIDSDKKEVVIPLDKDLFLTNKKLFLKVYADFGHTTNLDYFQILDNTSLSTITLQLCPENYKVQITNTKGIILQTNTLVIK